MTYQQWSTNDYAFQKGDSKRGLEKGESQGWGSGESNEVRRKEAR